MPDLYSSYAQLAGAQIEGIDYQRQWRLSEVSTLVFFAIHGGGIEPGTTELADSCAGDIHDFYTLDAFKAAGSNTDLHITSTRYDEPQALKMAAAATHSVSFHGFTNAAAVTYLGGLDYNLRDQIGQALKDAGFTVTIAGDELDGDDPKNLCNRTTRGMGVQLEVSNTQRALFFAGGDTSRANRKNTTAAFTAYVAAVKQGISKCLTVAVAG
ncbi:MULTISPECIES: poly-gamma-glutamate hydrolase family protein [unclassified Streptomyces]|uniref:poly-gamma-glutamate hydrolase family protein n=1 Tax=unclassified Streptomyces TaxID=2593676 RepID=UPI00332D511D